MKKIMDKVRSLLVLSLSAAIIMTSIPNAGMVAQATQAGEDVVIETEATETAATETEAIEITETAAEETATGETEAIGTTETTAEETATEETEATEETAATEEMADSEFGEIKEYQTAKLKITKRNTTIYTRGGKVLVAEVGYLATTKGNGIGYTATIEGGSYANKLVVDNSDPYKVYVSLTEPILSGTYYLILTPVVPKNVQAESVKIPIKVVASYGYVTLSVVGTVYKPAGKSVSLQTQAVVRNTDGKEVKAKIDYKVGYTYTGAQIPGNQVTISKSGKITIAKDATIRGFYVIVSATDSDGRTVDTNRYVSISEKAIEMGEPVIYRYSGNYPISDYQKITASELDESYFGVLKPGEAATGDAYGRTISYNEFTFKSSNPKSISIDKSGQIRVINPTGKPVTLTATAVDGSKASQSITVTISKETVPSIDDISIAGEFVRSGKKFSINTSAAKTIDGQENVILYNNPTCDMIALRLKTQGNYFVDASISKIKGAKNVTSKATSARKDWVADSSMIGRTYLVPTAQDIEITVKAGKETKTYILRENSPNAKKQELEAGEPKITTSATLYKIADKQTIQLYVGKKYAGKRVQIGYTGEEWVASNNAYLTTEAFLSGLFTSKPIVFSSNIDARGYLTVTADGMDRIDPIFSGIIGNASKPPKVTGSIKFRYAILEDTGSQAITTPTVVTFKLAKPSSKSDYKLQTSYTLKTDRSTTKVNAMNGEGYSYLYAKLTHTGTKAPVDKAEFISLKGSLDAKDLNNASEFTRVVQLCSDGSDYYVGVSEKTLNSLVASGKSGATMSGKLYLTYRVISPLGVATTKTDTIKVTFVVP